MDNEGKTVYSPLLLDKIPLLGLKLTGTELVIKYCLSVTLYCHFLINADSHGEVKIKSFSDKPLKLCEVLYVVNCVQE